MIDYLWSLRQTRTVCWREAPAQNSPGTLVSCLLCLNRNQAAKSAQGMSKETVSVQEDFCNPFKGILHSEWLMSSLSTWSIMIHSIIYIQDFSMGHHLAQTGVSFKLGYWVWELGATHLLSLTPRPYPRFFWGKTQPLRQRCVWNTGRWVSRQTAFWSELAAGGWGDRRQEWHKGKIRNHRITEC